MVQVNGELSLATLPSDIIRHIVLQIPEETDNMQLISQEWNSIVLEFRRSKVGLPRIDSFSFPWVWDELGKVCITIQRRYLRYFGVESEYHLFVGDGYARYHPEPTAKVNVYLPVAKHVGNGAFEIKDRFLIDRLAFILERTSKIGHLELSWKTISYHENILVLPQFSRVPVLNCRVVVGPFKQDIRSSILNIVRPNKIEVLEVIGNNKCDSEAVCNFITSAIQFVNVLKIFNDSRLNAEYQRTMYCGRTDAFWNDFAEKLMVSSGNHRVIFFPEKQKPFIGSHIYAERIFS